MAVLAKNTRLTNGSLRAYRAPKKVADCDRFILNKDRSPVCTDVCAAYAYSSCSGRCLYNLVGGKLAENGRVIGLDRPLQTPSASLVSGGGDQSVIFRVLCTNEHGEYSAPSASSNRLDAKYGDVVNLAWSGCTPYRVEALLTQSITHVKEIGKDPSQWVVVGDYTAPTANISFKPETWQLTDQGYDPSAYCDPPVFDCFVVTDDGFFVGWKDSMIWVSERHDPSKFPRASIKALHCKINNIVTAGSILYVATDDGMYLLKVSPDKEGSAISIAKTYENVIAIKNTLALVNSGCMFATRYGLYVLDERGGVPQNVTSKLVHEDEFEADWLPIYGHVQRGVYYATQENGESWQMDFPSSSGDANEYGRLVRLDGLGTHMVASKDGSLLYGKNGAYEFDGGASYLGATWESAIFTAPARTAMAKYKAIGEYLDKVTMTVIVDGKEVYTTRLSDDKICTLPRCVNGFEYSIRLNIDPSNSEVVVNKIQLATSVAELVRT